MPSRLRAIAAELCDPLSPSNTLDMPEPFTTTLDPRNVQTPLGELALRIRGGDFHGRVVRIRAAQCTIGSAPDCTLRLTTPGVRPLHCIISRAEAGATVRRWSPDTQLNGRAFSDALLTAGDRLEVGPIELEVLDDADLSPRRRNTEADAAAPPFAQLAGEIAEHLRRDLQRSQPERKEKLRRKKLASSNRRIKQLETELERVQTLLQAAQQTFEPTPVAADQPIEAQPQLAAWETQRQNLLKEVAEKGQLKRQLQAAQAEIKTLQSARQTGSVVEAANQQSQQRQAVWETERRELLKSLEEKKHLERRLEAALAEISKGIDQERLPGPLQQPYDHEQLAEERRELHVRAAELDQLQAWCNEIEQQAQQREEEYVVAQAKAVALQARVAELESQLVAANHERNPRCQQVDTQQEAGSPVAEQQAAAQAKALQGRIAQLEAQLAAANNERNALREQLGAQQAAPPTLPAVSAAAAGPPESELVEQLRQQAEQLATALASAEESQRAADLISQEWGQHEQELNQRIECLEKLASNLEDELRVATSQPDKVELAEEQRHTLEQQLTAAQRQWAEQRQQLEEQALSAHQQLQEAESQIASMRDALHSTHGQVRERDQLLAQLRDEVREQMAAWQTEREELLAKAGTTGLRDGAGTDRSQDAEEDVPAPDRDGDADAATYSWQQPGYDASMPVDHAEDSEDRYSDRGLLGRGSEEPKSVEQYPHSAPASSPNDSAQSVLARLGAAGLWRNPVENEEASSFESQHEEPRSSASPGTSAEASSVPAWRQMIPADEPVDSPNEIAPEQASSSYAPPSVEPPNAPGSEEEESIEAYMNRLMKRVRGDAVAQAYTPQDAPRPTVPSPAAEQPAAESAKPEEPPAKPVTPEEFVPRKAAPEQASDLAAMRELAVSSARQAISRSTQQRFQKSSLGTTLGACALVGLSVGLFGWGFDTGNTLAWAGCGVSLAAGFFLVIRRLRMRKLR